MARELPTRRFVRPQTLTNAENGKLDSNLLVPIRPYGRLYNTAAQAWQLMKQAARADGIKNLKPTSAYDTYRPYSVQRAVFIQRYTREPVSKNVRRWNGELWYLKPGLAPLAAPGTSIHGLGCAVDVWNVSQAGRLEWLAENAPRFGFYWEIGLATREPWHLIYCLRDRLP